MKSLTIVQKKQLSELLKSLVMTTFVYWSMSDVSQKEELTLSLHYVNSKMRILVERFIRHVHVLVIPLFCH